jgi:glutaminase
VPVATSPIQEYLERLHARFADHLGGEVAGYIPELANVDPDRFGICIASTDGHVYEVGDTRVPFTIQSMSKPFTYGIALEDRGLEHVLAKVGVEPSGDAFNEISLTPETGRPLNPMINAGAITSTSLVGGATPDERLARILDVYGRYAGRPVTVDEAIYASEHATGHRNRAIGHMLRTFDILTEDPEVPLDLYFQQCSVAIDCRDLSLMAATLANGGVHPGTRTRALRRDLVDQVLSVMTTCGMYDAAGEWVVDVGMPAKSGVAGGIFAVLPGHLGIAVFSPRLDTHGNSVRGVEVCRQLSRDLKLHFLNVARSARAALRARHTIREMPSTRRRPPSEIAALQRADRRCRIYQLQGDLLFAGVEAVVRDAVEACAEADIVVLDLREVTHVDVPAARTLAGLSASMTKDGKALVVIDGDGHPALQRALTTEAPGTRVFATSDEASEWCEDRLLDADPTVTRAPERIALADHRLFVGLEPEALARIEPVLGCLTFGAGETLLRRGEPASEILLLVEGQVSLTVPHPEIGTRRLSTLSAGMTVGEAAFVMDAARTTDARADRAGTAYVLPSAVLRALDDTDPAAKTVLLRNLLTGAYESFLHLTSDLSKL